MNKIEHNHNYYLLALWYKLHKYSRLLSIQFKDNSLTIAISGLNLKFASFLSYFHVKRLFFQKLNGTGMLNMSITVIKTRSMMPSMVWLQIVI